MPLVIAEHTSKAIADKCDCGYVMTKIPMTLLHRIEGQMQKHPEMYSRMDGKRPTHVLDIYKMRRGQYKNVRIYTYLDLGTGERKDLFMTTIDGDPIECDFTLFGDLKEPINDWRDCLDV